MEHSFSISESLRFGWHTLKAHSRLVYQILFTILGSQVAYAIVTKVLAHTALGFLAAAALFIAEIVFGIGATLISLKLARHEHASYADIVPPATLILQYLGAGILALVITLVPIFIAALLALALFTVAGGAVATGCGVVLGIAAMCAFVYFLLRYFFVKLAAVDGEGITGSLSKSARASHGHKWRLLGFLLVLILVNILGALLLLVGLLVSIPVTMLAYAHLYTKLVR